MPSSASCCDVCGERLTLRLPMVDLAPLNIVIPRDAALCFWCREDLMRTYGTTQIEEAYLNAWIASRIATAARLLARKKPLKRCEIGDGRSRCNRFATARHNGIWLCAVHARTPDGLRHYLDWRCQRIIYLEDHMEIIPPQPRSRAETPLTRKQAQTGSRNGNARLTDNDVQVIWQRIGKGEFNTTIARDFGVSHSMISAIRRKKSWLHLQEENDADQENC